MSFVKNLMSSDAKLCRMCGEPLDSPASFGIGLHVMCMQPKQSKQIKTPGYGRKRNHSTGYRIPTRG